jgi:hypothetical protein
MRFLAKISMIGAVVITAALISLPATAQQQTPPKGPPEKIEWKRCEKEARDYGCTGTDEEIWRCLEQHDANIEGECQKEHRKGDKRFGVDVEGELKKR